MKLKIDPKNCKYIVNKEKRKVICIINHTEELFFDFLDYPFRDSLWPQKKNFNTKLMMPKSFVGVATCSPEDEWDEELGKLIAFYKAKQKFGISFFKRANLFINELDNELNKYIDRFNDYANRLDSNMNHLEERIDELMNKEP